MELKTSIVTDHAEADAVVSFSQKTMPMMEATADTSSHSSRNNSNSSSSNSSSSSSSSSSDRDKITRLDVSLPRSSIPSSMASRREFNHAEQLSEQGHRAASTTMSTIALPSTPLTMESCGEVYHSLRRRSKSLNSSLCRRSSHVGVLLTPPPPSPPPAASMELNKVLPSQRTSVTSATAAATPTTATAAAELPTVNEMASMEESDLCCICLEDYTAENPKFFGECRHHFHLHCLLEWKQRSNSCPMCCAETLRGVGDADDVPLADPVAAMIEETKRKALSAFDEELALRLQRKYVREAQRGLDLDASLSSRPPRPSQQTSRDRGNTPAATPNGTGYAVPAPPASSRRQANETARPQGAPRQPRGRSRAAQLTHQSTRGTNRSASRSTASCTFM